MLKKKKLGIKDKLQEVVSNVTIDLFGIEEKVTENVIHFINEIEYREQLLRTGINVKIALSEESINVSLLCFKNKIRYFEIEELIKFFGGKDAIQTTNKEKLISKVVDYLNGLASEHNVSPDLINLRISSPSFKQVLISLYQEDVCLKQLKIGAIIKFFK